MAEVLLRERLTAAGVDAVVSSAGDLPGGSPASAGSVEAMSSRGLDLTGHVSTTITRDAIAHSDLIVAMARQHLRSAVSTVPDAFGRTFTLKELVRRGAAVGARRGDERFDEWLARLHEGRTTRELLGEDPSDDVADPIGGPDHLYEATAMELSSLVDRFVDLAFAAAASTETRESA